MTDITFFKDSKENVRQFVFEGHSGYAAAGHDIVCASISALVFNTINSIEGLTKAQFESVVDEKRARVEFLLTQDEPDENALLLMKSLELGCVNISNEYGKKYVKLHFKEV